jgi:hypothetical protein
MWGCLGLVSYVFPVKCSTLKDAGSRPSWMILILGLLSIFGTSMHEAGARPARVRGDLNPGVVLPCGLGLLGFVVVARLSSH